jgi:hypothetical protein
MITWEYLPNEAIVQRVATDVPRLLTVLIESQGLQDLITIRLRTYDLDNSIHRLFAWVCFKHIGTFLNINFLDCTPLLLVGCVSYLMLIHILTEYASPDDRSIRLIDTTGQLWNAIAEVQDLCIRVIHEQMDTLPHKPRFTAAARHSTGILEHDRSRSGLRVRDCMKPARVLRAMVRDIAAQDSIAAIHAITSVETNMQPAQSSGTDISNNATNENTRISQTYQSHLFINKHKTRKGFTRYRLSNSQWVSEEEVSMIGDALSNYMKQHPKFAANRKRCREGEAGSSTRRHRVRR